jgi:hypothetical protein
MVHKLFHGIHTALRFPVMEYSSHTPTKWSQLESERCEAQGLQLILNQFQNQPSAFASLKILIRYSDRVAEMEMSTGGAFDLISTMF